MSSYSSSSLENGSSLNGLPKRQHQPAWAGKKSFVAAVAFAFEFGPGAWERARRPLLAMVWFMVMGDYFPLLFGAALLPYNIFLM